MTEVLVYSPNISSRLQYTLDWVLSERLGLNLKITDSEDEFAAHMGAKINYSHHLIAGCLNIDSTSILYENSVNENFGEIGEWKGLKIIFKTESNDIPFDIFGAVFYCISRMEEYGENILDAHQRFSPSGSVLYKLEILQIPIVDLWLNEFKRVLHSFYPSLEFKEEEFKFINTFDNDQAFCYTGKGFLRNAGGLMKDILRLDFNKVIERILVLSNSRKDPYDTFEYLIQKHQDLDLNTIIFLLLADHGTHDKNIPISNKKFIQRIKLLREGDIILGIHPSYHSFNNPILIGKEVKRLADLQLMPVVNSRQHYLKFNFPGTFQFLNSNGIRHEFSMGYAETIGFRAGTAHCFNWFDLNKNEVTNLTIHPCCVMDVTLKNYLKLSPTQAKEKLKELIKMVKEVNGTFIPIWHNESISDYGEWEGWRGVYEEMLEYLKMKE